MPNPQQSLTIKKTKNYNLFVRSESNRKVNMAKHRKLYESMKKYGFLPYWPVVVYRSPDNRKRFEVADGQHRLAVAESLKIDVYYIVAYIDFNIAEVNNTQKTWSISDYAETYASQGKSDYQEGIDFNKDHPSICLSLCFAILAGKSAWGSIKDKYVNGDFQVTHREYAEKVAGVYCPIAAMSREVKNNRFLEACIYACKVPEFDPSRMVKSAESCRERLVPSNKAWHYLGIMEDIYNYRKGTNNQIPLKFLAGQLMSSNRRKNGQPESEEDE